MISISGTKTSLVTNGSTVESAEKNAFSLQKISTEEAEKIGKAIKNDIKVNWVIQPYVPLTAEENRLNEHYQDVMWVCTFPDQFDDSIWAAYDKNQPVGLLGLSAQAKHIDGFSEIKYIVSHPQVSGRGCGKSMVEKAVNFSVESGNEGRIAAFNVLIGAEGVYKKWGFVDKGGYMSLDPSTSRKWTNDNGQFHIDTKVNE